LKAPTYTPQYWVIDALDECQKYQELFTMLKNERPAFPLRIFITSRLMSDIYRIQKPLESSAILVSIGIPTQDSASDIERYIASRTDILPIDSERERTELAATIFRKSAGSFLWVRLVLDELEKVYASESIKKIIDSIPEGMVPYYQRIVQSMAANTLEKHISKAVLMWTVSCTRKMRIEELTHALKLDINTVLPSAKSAVEGLCGQLVTIDSTSGIVSLIHLTAREFLLADAGDFTIPKAASHERAAKACLALLSSAELKPPRTARQLSQAKPAASPFLDYAMTQFSEHIFFASAESEDLLGKIDAFLKTNALSWIERMARAGTLHILTRTSKNLKSYVDRREKYKSPLDRQIRNVDSWTIDLSRLVTQFGEALLHDPASIYFLIPPLCPTGSAIYQSFGKRSDGLVLVGHKDSAWDDCIAYVNFRDDMSSAVSCGESLIAVGMESGKVNLYNPRSCHKEAEIPHKHPIDLVHLSNGLLISCTTRFLVVHDINGTFLWQQRLKYRLLLLTSSEDNIVGVSQRGRYLRWNKKTGELVGDQDFPYRCDNDEEEGDNSLARRAPHVTSISPDFETLALGYRGGVVSLWDVEGVEHIGWAKDDQGRNPAKLLFNPNPNINLLLVIYNVNGLALFDTWSGSLQQEFTFSEDIGLLTASCSPDGRTLVTTDAQGNLHIWDFESLSILYHIHAPFPSFRILSFTSDGSYIVDVMDSSMRIWSPSVLVRKSIDEDASISDDASQLTIAEGISDAERTGKTTAIFPHPNLPVVLAGKYNGDVVAFSSKENKPAVHLYSHSESSFVVRVTAHKSNKVASSDVSGLVKIYSLSPTCLKLDSSPLELRINGAVRQLCFDESGDYLLISTALSDQVYSLRKGHCVGSLNFSPGDRKCWRWFSIPQRTSNGACLANVCDGVLRQYSIDSFPSLIDEDAELYLQYSPSDGSESKKEVEIEIATLSHSMKVLAMQIRYDTGFSFSSSTFLFDLSSTLLFTESSAKKIALSPVNQPITSTCKYFLGFSETAKSIIFLHHNSWVSSFDPTGKAPSQWVQHFFIPNDYLHSAAEALPVRTADGDIVLSHHGELVAIRNGMKFRSVRDLK
jgi:WD40 repeat protein